MKRITLLIILAHISLIFNAQLVLNTNLTPAQLVQNYLVGSGVTVSNIQFNGMPANMVDDQIAFFNAQNTNLGIDSGILMCTGSVSNALGPNDSGSEGTDLFAPSGDPDLNAISSVSINDAAILEFDIVPTGDTLSFEYSFASEEYMEYVGGGINDAFGIFLSGTGISGPYSMGAENIALIPGTTTPISIDNVNAFTNASYYVDNGDGFTAPFNTSNTYIQYDGRTVTLTAKYPVQCGGSYHLKFAIGDGVDGILDSGVFIEAGSLSSSGVQVSLNTPIGFFSNVPGTVYEGCALGSSVDFIFVRPDSTSSDTAFFNIGGNAINGTDYTNIPNNYVVFQNSDTAILTINVTNDGIVEGTDTLWLTVPIASAGPCSNIYDTVVLYIADPYDVLPYIGSDTTYYCIGQAYDFGTQINQGVPPYSYTWSDNSTGQNTTYTITQNNSDTVIINVIDGCGYTGSDTLVMNQIPPPSLVVDAGMDTTLTCAGQSVNLVGNVTGGVQPVSYFWSNGNNTMTVQPLQTTSYILTATDDCANTNTDTVTVFVPPYQDFTISSAPNPTVVECVGDQATVGFIVTGGGTQPYSYSWSNGSTDTLVTLNVFSSNTFLTATITDACGLDTTINFDFDIASDNFDFNVSSIRQCRNADSTASLTYTLQGNSHHSSINLITSPFGVSGFTLDSVSNTILISDAQEGIYTFEATNSCGITTTDSTQLTLQNCEITTPNVITPNNDGSNDFLIFGGLGTHPNSELKVYNRWGNLIYSDADYQNNWNGGGVPPGLYYYVLILTDGTVPGQFQGHVNIFY